MDDKEKKEIVLNDLLSKIEDNEKRKNVFLSFCFACVPGAGEMYNGLMKKGALLMLAATLCVLLSGSGVTDFLLAFAPVIWAYSFFDTFKLRNMNEEERKLNEENFLGDIKKFFSVALNFDIPTVISKNRRFIGAVIIFWAANFLINSVFNIIESYWEYFINVEYSSLFYSVQNSINDLFIFVFLCYIARAFIKTPKPQKDGNALDEKDILDKDVLDKEIVLDEIKSLDK